MSYVKIGSAYFQKERIKSYHLREVAMKDGTSQWQVRADTAILRRFDSKVKAEEYLDYVIGKLSQSRERQEGADANQETTD